MLVTAPLSAWWQWPRCGQSGLSRRSTAKAEAQRSVLPRRSRAKTGGAAASVPRAERVNFQVNGQRQGPTNATHCQPNFRIAAAAKTSPDFRFPLSARCFFRVFWRISRLKHFRLPAFRLPFNFVPFVAFCSAIRVRWSVVS